MLCATNNLYRMAQGLDDFRRETVMERRLLVVRRDAEARMSSNLRQLSPASYTDEGLSSGQNATQQLSPNASNKAAGSSRVPNTNRNDDIDESPLRRRRRSINIHQSLVRSNEDDQEAHERPEITAEDTGVTGERGSDSQQTLHTPPSISSKTANETEAAPDDHVDPDPEWEIQYSVWEEQLIRDLEYITPDAADKAASSPHNAL
ncbi:uncharacterized protein LOC122382161 [Amphibalanus amphitrite]|uniref:uncharacterized protein LOC122382161 n=1 Tax=Amphibalanus amphitrite TaxID=1232801 RepID=UPI001C900A44|nr:uncharacterized protein LOC122382161 [Amphibalanus amphitrite]